MEESQTKNQGQYVYYTKCKSYIITEKKRRGNMKKDLSEMTELELRSYVSALIDMESTLVHTRGMAISRLIDMECFKIKNQKESENGN